MEGDKSGIGRLERMKHGNGIKDREDKPRGIEIRIVETFTKVNPTRTKNREMCGKYHGQGHPAIL